jgi:type I restriction enzyme S subunit
MFGKDPSSNWPVRRLSEIATVNSGVALGRNLSDADAEELPYLRVANVQDGYFDLAEVKTVRVLRGEVKRYMLEPGDVVLTEGGDYDKLGRGGLWTGAIAPCLHQNHIFRVRTNRDVLLPEFLAEWIGTDMGKSYFRRCAKQSTNLASINSTQLKACPVPCPDIQEQQAIVAVLREVRSVVDHSASVLDQLIRIKWALSHDLLTGRRRVPLNGPVSLHTGT